MYSTKVNLNDFEKVKRFVQTVSKHVADFDLISGRYIVDGKSIMGIFSMNLSKDMILNIHCTDKNELISILSDLEEFIAA